MLDLNQMRDEAYTTSRSKGWYEDGRRSVPTYLVLVHSEVSEALEAWRESGDEGITAIETKPASEKELAVTNGFKPEGVAAELADVVIRVGDMAGAFDNINLTDAFERAALHGGVTVGDLSEKLGYLHIAISDTLSQWSATHSEYSLKNGLGEILRATFEIAKLHKIDLETAVRTKMAFNKTRPHRHGGKKV
jgi:NTP pyrophosphatase (non-canonical NTP hydrolase)